MNFPSGTPTTLKDMTHLSGLIPIPAFTMPGRLTLVDLIVVVAIIGAFAGGLRHRRSLLAAAGSALGTALLCWIVAAAVVAWAPAPYRTASPTAH